MHQPPRLNESGGVDLVPFPLGGDGFTDGADDLIVAGAAAQQAADVGLLEGEQAVAQVAVGGQADPVVRLMQKGRLTEAIMPMRPPPST